MNQELRSCSSCFQRMNQEVDVKLLLLFSEDEPGGDVKLLLLFSEDEPGADLKLLLLFSEDEPGGECEAAPPGSGEPGCEAAVFRG